MGVCLNDFKILSSWKADVDGPKWGDGEAEYLIDLSTKRRYWNESQGCVRFKCMLLTLGTPFVHNLATICNVVYRALKLISLYHFWEEGSQSLKIRMENAGTDLIRLIMAPIAYVGLELTALYGIVMPYDGRKLYATIERAMYGDFILAPCFQPDPEFHAFGGDPQVQNAF